MHLLHNTWGVTDLDRYFPTDSILLKELLKLLSWGRRFVGHGRLLRDALVVWIPRWISNAACRAVSPRKQLMPDSKLLGLQSNFRVSHLRSWWSPAYSASQYAAYQIARRQGRFWKGCHKHNCSWPGVHFGCNSSLTHILMMPGIMCDRPL
jgi:hypothetical protein